MMFKSWKYILACLTLTTSVSFAVNCPFATDSSDAGFCQSFKAAAECRCGASGLPKGMCTNMSLLYTRMISMFGSLERACQFQHDTPTETCLEDWQCYRYGGTNARNELCSGTGLACEAV